MFFVQGDLTVLKPKLSSESRASQPRRILPNESWPSCTLQEWEAAKYC